MNARSLLAANRLLDLEIMCVNHNVDVLCVSETWLSPSRAASSAPVIIPGFHAPFRRDRPSGTRGGGVAVFVRSGLSVSSVSLPSELEAVCVQLHLPKRKSMYIAAVYRPPSGGLPLTDFVDKLDDVHGQPPGCTYAHPVFGRRL